MTTSVFNRRRAERFAQLLDEAQGGRRHHVRSSSDDELAELVAVSDQLVALDPPVEVDPDFRAGLRAMLVATAEREGIGATATIVEVPLRASRLPGRRVRARGAVIIGVAVGAIAVSGMSAASENAMPGDALYGVKRSTERAQLALASSDVTRGQLFLDFARTRLAEAQAIPGGAGFAGVLADMDGDTREGVKLLNASAVQRRDDTPLDAVDSFITGQRQQITGMLDLLAGPERARAVDSLALLDQVSQRSKALRGTLDCNGAASTGTDALGPKPAACWTSPGQSGATGRGSETGQRGEREPTPARTENNGSTPSAGSSGATPAPGTPPSPDASTPAPSPSPSGDDGLLDGLGRILGDLLG